MSQKGANVKEMAIHLCQQLSEVFGTAYCRIALLPRDTLPAEDDASSTNGSAAEVITVGLAPWGMMPRLQSLNGEATSHAQMNAEPFAPDADIAAQIASAGQYAKPKLRFRWQNDTPHGDFGCLDLAFRAPRRFSAMELSALLLMAEIARAMLAFTRMAATQATAAEQVARTLQGDLFAMPFLEAKKHWIDAFEHEYLRQQMMKYFGNISKAARAARISRYTLYALLNKFQFSAQSFKRMKPQKSSLSRNAAQNGRKKSEEKDTRRDIFEPFV